MRVAVAGNRHRPCRGVSFLEIVLHRSFVGLQHQVAVVVKNNLLPIDVCAADGPNTVKGRTIDPRYLVLQRRVDSVPTRNAANSSCNMRPARFKRLLAKNGRSIVSRAARLQTKNRATLVRSGPARMSAATRRWNERALPERRSSC